MSRLVEPHDFLQVKEEDYDLAIAKFNMTDKMVRESIESFHNWYKKQPHLPEGAFSDNHLLRHLLASGFSLEKTKQKIENLFTARNMVPELLGDRDSWSENVREVLKHVQGAVLPKRLDDMTRVVVFSFQSDDVTNFSMVEAVKLALMVIDYRLYFDLALGDLYVADLKDLKLGHLTQLTPALMKKTFFIIQKCFGTKIKGIHFLNVPTYAEIFITLLKAAASEKVASRVHIHKDNESLTKFIPKSILTSDLGGDEKTNKERTDDLYEQLVKPEVREWFLKQDQFKSDESKRIGVKSDIYNELLGLQGSFRSINID